ncbi:MAG: hypothetical protein ACP5II_04385 [Infirmifilum sp.]|jgi:predicted membrane protein (TIGR00267 family)|uniref:VIT family protein n=1 Tax=Infirmifilum uzonense TaxID=1550241 RepID=A0A0F7FJB1_9CREN|nr:hypothetical protein [Infirmifilum uzonense]AKG39097.1 hypothetical protein MA03_07370 [Infirmifilum uzonense]
MGLLEDLHNWLHSLMKIPSLGNLVPGVARRYMAVNLYDGSLLALGVIVSSLLINLPPSKTVLNGLVLGFSSAVSGFMGAFLVERAELARELRELEKHLFIRLGRRQVYVAGIFLSTVNAASTSTPIFLSLVPFALCERGLLPMQAASVSALVLVLLLLLGLGYTLGKSARENPLKYGLLALASGLLIIMLELVLGKD